MGPRNPDRLLDEVADIAQGSYRQGALDVLDVFVDICGQLSEQGCPVIQVSVLQDTIRHARQTVFEETTKSAVIIRQKVREHEQSET